MSPADQPSEDQLFPRIAFLSTPSIFFALPEDDASDQGQKLEQYGSGQFVEFDKQWDQLAQFQFYDFNDFDGSVPGALHGQFDVIVITRPSSADVWEKYTASRKLAEISSQQTERRLRRNANDENSAEYDTRERITHEAAAERYL